MRMRVTVYKNSFLASLCSIIGSCSACAAIIELIVDGIKSFDRFLSLIFMIAAGVGLMVLGAYISRKKEERREEKLIIQKLAEQKIEQEREKKQQDAMGDSSR